MKIEKSGVGRPLLGLANSVLGLIMSSYPYLRPPKAQFPLRKQGGKSSIRNKLPIQMSAGSIQFCPVVKCGAFCTVHGMVQPAHCAQPARFGGWVVGLGPFRDFPVDAIVYTKAGQGMIYRLGEGLCHRRCQALSGV